MIELNKIKIGDVVYTHDKEDNSVNKMVIKEIKHTSYHYFIHGVNGNGVPIRASSLDHAFYTKREAIKSYMSYMTEKMIDTIVGIE